MSRTLIWLRGDLRLADNPLFAFATAPEALLCVFALDEAWLEPRPGLKTPRIGPARLRFLWESLIALRGELLKRGSDLLVRIGDPVEAVAGLVDAYAIDEVRVRADPGAGDPARLAGGRGALWRASPAGAGRRLSRLA